MSRISINPIDQQAWRLVTRAAFALIEGDRKGAISLIRSALVTLEGKEGL